MSIAASHQEIQRAKKLLESQAFQVAVHENGHLIVNDPVFNSGPRGTLKFHSYQSVAVRNLDDAIKFISARS